MRNLRNGFKPILLGTIFVLMGWMQQSQGAVKIETEKEDAQLDRRVELSFFVKHITAEISIIVYTKPSLQILGVKKGSNDGEITKLEFGNDSDWTKRWQSGVQTGRAEGVQFSDVFSTKYNFVEPLPMKFKVVSGKKTLGIYLTYLSDIASNVQVEGQLQKKNLNGKWQAVNGVITIECKEVLLGYDDEVSYKLVGQNFETRSNMFPYIIISKLEETGNGETKWKPVDKTFMIGFNNPENPEFTPLSIRVSQIIQQNIKELQLKFKCMLCNYDNPNQAHIELGEFDTTYRKLIEDREFSCVPPDVDNDDTNIVTLKAKVTVPTFLEIKPGLEIKVSIAVDFTESNKHGKYENEKLGMHKLKENGKFNDYEQAILAIIPIVEHYGNDKGMPLMGFGCSIPKEEGVNHCFPLRPMMGPDKDGKELDENCVGTLGVLEAYRNVILNQRFALAGPTLYQPSIEHVRKQACNHKGQNDAFYLLVMLTDGIYVDESQTKAEIAMASECPMFIIFVGIGDDNFEKLVELDNDNGLPLKGCDINGVEHRAVADIVQYIGYKDFLGKLEAPAAMNALKDEVLKEFPVHVQNYFKLYQLQPRPHSEIQELNNSAPKSIVANNYKDLASMMIYAGA